MRGQYALEIIDVLENPQLAEDEKILATPTLIKQLPPPLRRVIGDLSDTEKVLLGLEVRPTASAKPPAITVIMTTDDTISPVDKLPTGIASFDVIAKGGLPMNRTTLLSGTAGSGKTVFAVQFLAAGIQRCDEHGVFVTFEESASDIRTEHAELRLGPRAMGARGQAGVRRRVAGSAHRGHRERRVRSRRAARARAERGQEGQRQARRRSIHSARSFRSSPISRSCAASCSASRGRLKSMGVTALLTAERTLDYGPVARFGIEEFIADNVMVLRNVLEDETSAAHDRDPQVPRHGSSEGRSSRSRLCRAAGMVVIPLSAIQLKQKSSNVRTRRGTWSSTRCAAAGFSAIR